MTTACTIQRENLALRAGGDLPSGPDHAALDAHLQGCASCRDLATALEGDRALVARAAAEPDPASEAHSLVASVLARAAAEAVAEGRYRPADRAPSARRDFGLAAFGRMAAAVAIVAAAAVLGYGLLVHDAAQVPAGVVARTAPSEIQPPAIESPVQVASLLSQPDPAPAPRAIEPATRPVRVHRAGGPAVEIEWEGDGRETAPGGGASPYKVLASASPRDFSEARPVLVSGRRLVASSDLPSLRTADRSITFFRVE